MRVSFFLPRSKLADLRHAEYGHNRGLVVANWDRDETLKLSRFSANLSNSAPR